MFFLSRKHRTVWTVIVTVLCFFSTTLVYSAVIQTKLRRIVIDPGHGGAAAGAVGHTGTREKDVVLSVAKVLGQLIEEQLPDVKVYYTRTKDVDVDLAQRGKLANQHKADLFISIHANSNKSRSEAASGTETFVMGLDKSDNNLAVARRENAAILNESDYASKYEGYDPNSPESFILFSLLQNSYMDQSITLASMIEDQYVMAKRKSRGVKQGPFLVLWRTGMPSVLTEIGFISNPYEEEYMNSAKGQLEIATNILEAVKNYKKLIEGNAFTSVAKPRESAAETAKPMQKDTAKPVAEPEVRKVDFKEVAVPVPVEATPKLTPCYGIQLSSSKVLLDTRKAFKGISDVFYFEKDGLYKYYTGCYPTRAKAQLELPAIRKIVEGAFVIQVNSGSGSGK